ncbi:MAG: hypothetical protein JW938_05505 [Candidatus Omnitrophica bacterium]|nr:hypothetical protein [Candidatus Omnitrophota bacterium]
MRLKEILEQCATLSVYEERSATDEYYEIVFYRKDIEQWERNIAAVMGGVAKPAGTKPTREQLQATQELGGLWIDQTLFMKETENEQIVAMFWPWQDRAHVTLKLKMFKK